MPTQELELMSGPGAPRKATNEDILQVLADGPPVMDANAIASELPVSDATIRKRMGELIDGGEVETTKIDRATVYYISDRNDELDDDSPRGGTEAGEDDHTAVESISRRAADIFLDLELAAGGLSIVALLFQPQYFWLSVEFTVAFAGIWMLISVFVRTGLAQRLGVRTEPKLLWVFGLLPDWSIETESPRPAGGGDP